MMRAGPHQSVVVGEGWAVIEDVGGRLSMEDRFIAAQRILGDVQLFGVFDGHNGADVAMYCTSHMVDHIKRELTDHSHLGHLHPVEHALTTAVERLDLEGSLLPGMREVGSTACMVVLTPEDAWFVNVGDSRAIVKVNQQVHQMTLDHKPTLRSELDRVQRHGGFISNTDGTWRINGRLNLSRSIGDWSMRPFIIPTPTIRHHRRVPHAVTDEYTVLATNGLYDVMSNLDVVRIIDMHPHTPSGVTHALTLLVSESRRRGSRDNITIVYIGLRRAGHSTAEQQSQASYTAGGSQGP